MKYLESFSFQICTQTALVVVQSVDQKALRCRVELNSAVKVSNVVVLTTDVKNVQKEL